MGGYGALKWALRAPERFAAAASLSGTADLAAMQRRGALRSDVADRVFGGRPVAATTNDLFWLLDRVEPTAMPALWVSCGTEDPLIDSNRRLTQVLRDKGFAVSADFGPGAHEWGYWDARIEDVLSWLPLGVPTTDPA